MFKEMRRNRQLLSEHENIEILKRGTSGVLALAGEEYPYAVPLSYIYDNGKIYFHCAKNGQKIDMLKANGKASFCVIDKDEIVPKEYTTYFKSVIAFGNIRIIEDEKQKRAAIEKLAEKYSPAETAESKEKAVNESWARLCMLEMTVVHMTGKQAIELARKNVQ